MRCYMKYEVVSLKERFDLFDIQDELCSKAWPEFMLHDPIANDHWMEFIEAYKEFQLLMLDGETIIGIINSLPLYYDGNIEDLPEEGWDWGVKQSIKGLREGIKPNRLFGVQIIINPEFQGMGLSSLAVKEMGKLVKKHGLLDLIIAVRPSNKHHFPLIPMDKYINWERSPGEPYDNWLRVHTKAGGSIIKICNKAMYIPGTVNEWTEWTGQSFPGSGDYIIKGALNPVKVTLDKNLVEYTEPNVWVIHRV